MGDSVVNIVCGDCGSVDTPWASINRGLFLCNECSFIHRSLGPQYSRIKSFVHSKWHPNMRKMVTTLASGPANNVLEHTLLDPSKSDNQMKKPVPGDSLEIVKKRFITLKHVQHQFVLRQKIETFDERNEELHSTVRTGDLGVSLRLITSGADPNFFHPERGTRPLHVACRAGQLLQVELLFVHGAQIDAPDYLGQTPAEHALAAGFKDLVSRIEELRYHLTDQLSFFVCGESPDHNTAKHILIPPANFNSIDQEERIKSLPPHMLEQLTADLYDEVDRRQTEKNLIATSPDHARFSIAFLPVNSHYPSVRNQTRQKFAKITDSDLSSLIITVLREGKRRHCNGSSLLETDKDIFLDNNGLQTSGANLSLGLLNEDDEFPLYDSVASDEDIVMSEPQTIQAHKPPSIEVGVRNSNINSTVSCEVKSTGNEKMWELESLKYELKVTKLMLTNSLHENLKIRAREQKHNYEMDRINSNNVESTVPPDDTNKVSSATDTVVLRQHSPSANRLRSVSMYVEQFEHASKEMPVSLPVRPNTADASIGKPQQQSQVKSDVSNLVQVTTRDIVELIKVLMEYARTSDFQGVELTSNKIYDAAEGMASILLRKEYDQLVKNSLENVLFQVLRMKSEIPLLIYPEYLIAATGQISTENQKSTSGHNSELYVQKIRQLCFEIGAAMKRLVNLFV